ncbi:hypothetical protein [Anaeromyxobacter diazotrophicus]|uniref:Uncharacterized protein n=1 Tax=Anaeromyxobacter diazotrophicus TaxID=2590199 RepID=A0A7I9VT44_9BACT|nr:hypothetical protein [Anaeromyxobacter diazotrophicus]GEJ59398.1 hypothetical protein AMYX_41390 [Anaeromyxobacter diazotrophicus]
MSGVSGARAGGVAPGAARSGAAARSPPPGAFAAALARARTAPRRARPGATAGPGAGLEEAGALARSAADAGQAALGKRRRGAEEGHQALGERRSSAEPDGGAAAPRSPEAPAPGAAEPRAPEGARAGPLWPPAALEALALAARRGERPSLELSMGREVRVTLVRAARGVEVLLDVRAGLRPAAEAELPRLVAALRERGVAVARAEVRAPSRALTARQGSATRAPLQRDGTVAKW